MNNTDIFILIFGVSYSFLLINFMDNGLDFVRQLFFLIPVIIVGVLFALFGNKSEFIFLSWGFITLPLIIFFFYNIFNLISWKINNREFRLKIRGARNIYKQDVYNWTDTMFSLLLIFSFFVWPILLAILCK